MSETLTDTQAMIEIHLLLDRTEWDSETIALVAEIVKATGREIRDPNDWLFHDCTHCDGHEI